MKKILLTAIIAFASLTSTQTMAQQGFGTNTPDKSSAVDIVSTKRGLLIPRIDLTSTSIAAPVSNPAQSLLVYNKNIEGDVTPGFYYWENNKWVRVMSSNIDKTSSVVEGATTNVSSVVSASNPNNTEYKVEVKEAALSLQNIGGSLNAAQITAGNNKQVLVTKEIAPNQFASVWVDASEIIDNGIAIGDGLTKDGNTIRLGGTIEGNVVLDLEEGGSIKINDLQETPDSGLGSFAPLSDKIMIMNEDGTLKQSSVTSIISSVAKNATAQDGSIIIEGGTGATLKDMNVKVADLGISNQKLANASVTQDKMDGGLGLDGRVPVANATGDVTYQPLASALGKNLSTDGKIVIGSDNETVLNNAVLVETHLKIREGSIGTAEITNASVTADKINADVAGNGLVKNTETGKLDVNTTATGIGKSLTTDNVIQIIGDGTTTSSATASVLKDIKLEIGQETIQSQHIATGAVTTTEILDATIQPIDLMSGGNSKVMVTDVNGVVSWINQTELGNTVTVNNGLTKTLNNIQLGGELMKPTVITTDGDKNTNTLAIFGLQPVATANNIVVAQNDGVLRTTTRSISATTASGLTVSSITGYSPYVQEVNVSVTAGSSNFDINLPDAVVANGQVINVKLTNTTEVDGYVSIKTGTTELSYGALPFQSWIIKSNGATWVIVGRN